MSAVVPFGPTRSMDVRVDEDGYVVLPLGAWRRYARLFSRDGISANEALDTLEDFYAALSRCPKQRATVHRLPHPRSLSAKLTAPGDTLSAVAENYIPMTAHEFRKPGAQRQAIKPARDRSERNKANALLHANPKARNRGPGRKQKRERLGRS